MREALANMRSLSSCLRLRVELGGRELLSSLAGQHLLDGGGACRMN